MVPIWFSVDIRRKKQFGDRSHNSLNDAQDADAPDVFGEIDSRGNVTSTAKCRIRLSSSLLTQPSHI